MAAMERTLFELGYVEAVPIPVVDARRGKRMPLAATVRAGWIDDSNHLRYAAATGINISEHGLAMRIAERLRMSALVHLELPDRRLSAVGRVRSCVHITGGWRVGIELSGPFLADSTELVH
jgi:hypothetical protein